MVGEEEAQDEVGKERKRRRKKKKSVEGGI